MHQHWIKSNQNEGQLPKRSAFFGLSIGSPNESIGRFCLSLDSAELQRRTVHNNFCRPVAQSPSGLILKFVELSVELVCIVCFVRHRMQIQVIAEEKGDAAQKGNNELRPLLFARSTVSGMESTLHREAFQTQRPMDRGRFRFFLGVLTGP